MHIIDATPSAALGSYADPAWSALQGTWRLDESEIEYEGAGERRPMYPAPAVGFIVFGSDRRIAVVVEVCHPTGLSDSQTPGHAGMAYTGICRVSNGTLQIDVDAASLHGWRGTIQKRRIRIESDRLHITSEWVRSPLHGDAVVRARRVWRRASGCVSMFS
jgi:hypothetical protein